MHVFFFWMKEFLNGREGVEDELRSGRLVKVRTDENIKQIEELVRSDSLKKQIWKKKKTTDVARFAAVSS
jgi:hypothetical protein